MNMQQNIQALSVSDVNRYIKALVNRDEILSSISVRGEISNFKRHSAGHLYFTLKDEGGEIAAVMFRADAARMSFNVCDGMRVVVYGSVDVYEKSGRYQVYVRTMIADGIGAMAQAYERLKRKLESEGLFAAERKRALPTFPQRIGVITAPTGAAIRDILNITGRRYPLADVLIYPSLVQGADAPASLRAGLEYLNADGTCDVIILGRGGGSIEDLWAFNDEALARAVAASEIPVISAVGHETDFTLCDFVADMRAPTPSAAAEIAVPDVRVLLERTGELARLSQMRLTSVIDNNKNRVARLGQLLSALSPEMKLSRMREQVERRRERLDVMIEKIYEARLSRYKTLLESLNVLNPLSVLQRGYGALRDTDGNIVARAKDMSVGQRVELVMSDGRADAEIISVTLDKNK